jgi:hypothetical protein
MIRSMIGLALVTGIQYSLRRMNEDMPLPPSITHLSFLYLHGRAWLRWLIRHMKGASTYESMSYPDIPMYI